MKGSRSVVLLLGLIVMLVACGLSSAGVGTQADIRGTITNINRADAQSGEKCIIGSVLIEGAIEEDTEFDKASVTITDKTGIFQQEGQGYIRVTFESLEIGQRVQAQFTGPVMESYPVQATASEIVILR